MRMDLEQIADEVVETDFLIIGGGWAGCMAAIRTRQNAKIDVAIMEKAAIKTSGEAVGLDHHGIQHPYFTGVDPKEAGTNIIRRFGGLQSLRISMASARDSLKSLVALEEIGVKLREDDNTYKMIQHQRERGGPVWNRPVPGSRGGDLIYYRGSDVKERLTIAAQKSGARVFNRTMLTSLITKDNTIVGATGVSTRTGKFRVFKAKAVLISTGCVERLYLYPFAPFPTNLFYSFDFPGNHGGGTAAAYRAGAKIAGMEFLRVGIVTAGLPGGGGMFWKMKNSKGEFLEEKFPDATMAKLGGLFPPTVMSYMPDMQNPAIERDVLVYDPSKATDDEIVAMWFTNAAEWPMLLKWNKARGDPRKAPPLELRPLTVGLAWGLSGILAVNEWGEASVKNLFSAGNVSSGAGGGGPGAVTWGYRVGEHVRELVPEIKPPVFGADQAKQIEAHKKRALISLGRKGDNPLELEEYIRKINDSYVGIRKTEPRLKRAIELFNIAKERFVPTLGACNPHELMRVLEVQDIVELSELHAQASLLRTESRMGTAHYRVDYPKQDDVKWLKSIVIQKVDRETKYTFEERQ